MFSFGSHLSFDIAFKTNNSAVQFMFPPSIDNDMAKTIKSILQKKNLQIVAHASYTINLCHPESTPKGLKSIDKFKSEISMLYSILPPDKIGYIVFHVGKCLEYDIDEAISTFIKNLTNIVKYAPPNVAILIETPAGQGSELFTNPVKFANMFKHFLHFENLGICIDTCHIFASGYHFFQYIKTLNSILTRLPINLIHLNDSQCTFGSKVDRHASLGKGYIFDPELGGSKSQLEKIIKWAFKNEVPIILETDNSSHQYELSMIRHVCEINEPKELENDDAPKELENVKPTINQHICQILGYLAQATDNRFKRDALRKAVDTINNYDLEIKSVSQIIKLPAIGKSIVEKITEILKTGTLEEYELHKDQIDAINNLTQISGIGSVTANKIYEQYNIVTIDELNKAVNEQKVKLTPAQRSGLKHHNEINLRIPRCEIDEFSLIFNDICKQIDPELKHSIVGSYRRLKPDSGDIDVLFVNPKIISSIQVKESRILEKIMQKLKDTERFHTDSILSQGSSKVLFIAHIDNKPARRIDFLMTPKESLATSLMYFTGSKEFNLMARKKAISMGLKLNEYGLFDSHDQRLSTPTEEAIFEHLHIPYLAPNDR